jgi:hypothetical protein
MVPGRLGPDIDGFHLSRGAPYNPPLQTGRQRVESAAEPLPNRHETGHTDAMQDKIPDFTDTELWVIRQAVAERFRREVEIQQADAELRLNPGDRELTLCPVVYWRDGQAQFVIFKTGVQAYRNQFFYSVLKQYGTGRDEYTDIGECVMILLQVQADHAAKNALNPA